ncbi:hypothetical protein C4J95_3069 [Pseudomonas orientalis]|nr:hypothetical protein C4J96_2882 [Pseudomonas orientalis]AZF00530.1 hypothetical protein C4J95_3069 [Pseudomonas orientalis]
MSGHLLWISGERGAQDTSLGAKAPHLSRFPATNAQDSLKCILLIIVKNINSQF